MGKMVVFLSCIGMVLFFAHVDCAAFRCGDGFVSVGDIKTKVVLECGQPTSKEKVGVKKETGESSTAKKITRHKESKKKNKANHPSLRTEYEGTSNKRIEKWYYNCGDNDFIYILTFEGDTLKQEETGGYGKGKSDCGGKN
jgi:hypothetical protein